MIARVAWYLGLLAIALITIGVEFDRASATRPALAELVPPFLRSEAQPRIVAAAFARGDMDEALSEARRLVRTRPVPAEHLTALSQIQFAAGAPDAATMTIQYAAQRGWRDSLAQEAMLRLALQHGDQREAARRYAALFLRQKTPDALLEQYGPAVFAAPDDEARAMFAAIVAGAERSHDMFARRGARVLPPAAFAGVFAEVSQSGATFDCANLANARRALERRAPSATISIDQHIADRC